MEFDTILERVVVRSSVPCRVDLGGTLDISTFYLPLAHMAPSTFNLALDMRTRVELFPHTSGRVRVSSRGFKSAEFEADRAPYDHPLGLMFAVAAFFHARGVHIHIESSSPPRSALGGSSSAATALVGAFFKALGDNRDPGTMAMIAHYIESSVAGVPCGLQDQLAAAFGGVNHWLWRMGDQGPEFVRKPLEVPAGIDDHILVAYCGRPHVSRDINKRWVNRFLSGEKRDKWEMIAGLTTDFVRAFRSGDFALAGDLMNRETRIRLSMTPDVLDETGLRLFELADGLDCGCRFTGAGGGGCVWAVGEKSRILKLKEAWAASMSHDDAMLLNTAMDSKGIIINKSERDR